MGAIRKTTSYHPASKGKLPPPQDLGEKYWFFCDGCGTHHTFTTKLYSGEVGPVWKFDGNEESPTFSPSLLCNGSLCTCKSPGCKKDHPKPELGINRCHLFLRAGMVQYLADCTHSLSGKTVPVQPPCF